MGGGGHVMPPGAGPAPRSSRGRPVGGRRLRSGRRPCLIWLLALLPAACGLPARFVPSEADLTCGRYAPSVRAFADTIVVASYNIQYGEKIAEALDDLLAEPHLARADVLLLQEMDPRGCDRIARERGYDYVYYPASVHPHHDRLFGNAILTRGEIRACGFIELPKHGILSGTNRIAVVAEIRFGARSLRAVSLHTSTPMLSQEQRSRTSSSQVVRCPVARLEETKRLRAGRRSSNPLRGIARP